MQPSHVMPSIVSVTVVVLADCSARARSLAPPASIRVRTAATRRRVIIWEVYTDVLDFHSAPLSLARHQIGSGPAGESPDCRTCFVARRIMEGTNLQCPDRPFL